MNFNKDDIFALAGAIILHLILLLFLYFAVIKTFVPNDDGGIPVNFGYIAIASGPSEPLYTESQPKKEVPTQQPVRKPEVVNQKELITQNKEETVHIPAKKETKKETVVDANAKKAKEEADRKLKEDADKKRIEDEQKKQAESIDNLAVNAFGKGSSQENNQGDATTGTGNQGSPFGNSGSGANVGTGGTSISFNLGGRMALDLPRPLYNSQIEGRIVVDITVNPNGDVINAKIGKGTNIVDTTLRNNSLNAANRAKFKKIKDTNNQSGTITYNYKLN